MQPCTSVFSLLKNYFNHGTICSWQWVSLNYCRAALFCATSVARPFAPVSMSVSRSHQCPFLGSFLGKPTLQRFPIGIDGLCSTDLRRSFGHVTNCRSIFFMLMIHFATLDHARALTSHPTPPHRQTKKEKHYIYIYTCIHHNIIYHIKY